MVAILFCLHSNLLFLSLTLHPFLNNKIMKFDKRFSQQTGKLKINFHSIFYLCL